MQPVAHLFLPATLKRPCIQVRWSRSKRSGRLYRYYAKGNTLEVSRTSGRTMREEILYSIRELDGSVTYS